MQKGKRKPFPLPSCRLHRLAQKKLRTVSERQNVPNKPSGLTESGKALQSLIYALLRHSQHQPPGSLRVEYEGALRLSTSGLTNVRQEQCLRLA